MVGYLTKPCHEAVEKFRQRRIVRAGQSVKLVVGRRPDDAAPEPEPR